MHRLCHGWLLQPGNDFIGRHASHHVVGGSETYNSIPLDNKNGRNGNAASFACMEKIPSPDDPMLCVAQKRKW